MTLAREIEGKKGGGAPTHRFSRPYVSANVLREDDEETKRKVERAIAADKRKYGAEEHERRVKEKIGEDLKRAEKLRKEEVEKGERKIKRMERREAEGKDPSKMFSTDEEDDGVDNTVLVSGPPTSPDPRNSSFGRPLSIDYRLKEAQDVFEASGEKRTVMWRPGTSPVKSGKGEGEEEENQREEGERGGERDEEMTEGAEKRGHREVEREEKERENYAENMKIVYEGVEEEALRVREMLEKTGADPDSRRELVVLAAQLISVNEQLIGEKEEESKKHVREHKEARARSKSEAGSSRSRSSKSSKREKSHDRQSRRPSSQQTRCDFSSASDKEK